jgi:hypothetical protein
LPPFGWHEQIFQIGGKLRLVIEAAILVAGIAWCEPRSSSPRPGDFLQYWAVGQVAENSRIVTVYSKQASNLVLAYFGRRPDATPRMRAAIHHWRMPGLQITATPLLYSVFEAIGPHSFAPAYRYFRRASYTLLLVGFIAAGRALRLPVLAVAVAAASTVIHSRPLRSDIYYGNVSAIQIFMAAAILISLIPERAEWAALTGAVTAFSVLFKPTFVVPAAMLTAVLLLDDRRRAAYLIAGALASTAALVWWSSHHLDDKCQWLDWYFHYRSFVYLPPRVTGLIVPRSPEAAKVIAPATVLLIAAAAYWAKRRDPDIVYQPVRPMLAVLAGLAAIPMASPISHAHYFILPALPGLYFLGRRMKWDLSINTAVKAAGIAGYAMTLRTVFGNTELYAIGFNGSILIFAAMCVEVARQPFLPQPRVTSE